MMDWSKYAPYFRPQEFYCRHCGEEDMSSQFMDVLLEIRRTYNRPMRITSGYRCPDHPVERHKMSTSGAHVQGIGCDVAVYGEYAVDLVEVALAHGVKGVGLKQHSGSGIHTRFVHLDIMTRPGAARLIWTYE